MILRSMMIPRKKILTIPRRERKNNNTKEEEKNDDTEEEEKNDDTNEEGKNDDTG